MHKHSEMPIIDVALPGDVWPSQSRAPKRPSIEIDETDEDELWWNERSRDGDKMAWYDLFGIFTDPKAPEDMREIARQVMLKQGGRLVYPTGREITPAEVLGQVGVSFSTSYRVEIVYPTDILTQSVATYEQERKLLEYEAKVEGGRQWRQ